MSDTPTPYFLVALPQMDDPNFARTVILVAQHDAEGAFGLILNHPLRDEENNPTQMTAEVKDVSGHTLSVHTEDIFRGGPVGDESLFALHMIEALGTEDTYLGSGLWLTTEAGTFQKLLEVDGFKRVRRFVMGYASWEKGQLESELRSGAWVVVPFDQQGLFEAIDKRDLNASEHMWRKILLKAGIDPLTLIPSGGGTDPGYN